MSAQNGTAKNDGIIPKERYMEDFSEYADGREKNARGMKRGEDGTNYGGANNCGSGGGTYNQSGAGVDANELLQMLAGKYEGKSEDELLASIFAEAQKARKNGSLSDGDIDNFVRTVAPMLSPAQQKKLMKVAGYLKSGKIK